MVATLTSFLAGELKVRWQEPFLSEALNAHMATISPSGIFRGFYMSTTAVNRRLSIDPDPGTLDHVAAYTNTVGANEYHVKIRRTNGPFTVDIPNAYLGQTIYIALYVSYAASSTTTGEVRAYSLAEYAAAPEKNDLVLLGTVVMPAVDGVIPAGNISYAARSWAWRYSPTQGVRWTSLLHNSNFEWTKEGEVGAPAAYWDNSILATLLNIGGTYVSTDSFTGKRSLELPQDNPAGGLTGVLLQYVNRPVDSNTQKYVRVKIAGKLLATVASGTFVIAVRFTDKSNLSVTYQTLDITNAFSVGSWTYLEKYIPVSTDPNVEFIQSVGLDFSSVLFTGLAPGTAGMRLDAFQAWVEERDNDTTVMPTERNSSEGRFWALAIEDLLPADNSAVLKFDSTAGSDGFGGLVLTSRFKNPFSIGPAPRLIVRGLSIENAGRTLGGYFTFNASTFGGRGSVDLTARDGTFPSAPSLRAGQIELEASPGLSVDTPRLSIARSDAAIGYPKRTLLLESGAYVGASYSRIYRAALAIGNERLEITSNAKWDPIGAQWSQDDATKSSRVTSFRDDGVEVQTMPAGSAPWASWSGTSYFSLLPLATNPILRLLNGEIRLDTPGSFSNPPRSTNADGTTIGAVLDANALLAKSIPKAWGTFRSSSGTLTVRDAFGIASIASLALGTSGRVTLVNAMADTNYAIIGCNRDDTLSADIFSVTNITTTTFDVSVRRPSTEAQGTIWEVSFIVFGAQS